MPRARRDVVALWKNGRSKCRKKNIRNKSSGDKFMASRCNSREEGRVKLFETWGEFSPGWTMSSGDSSLDSVVKSITRLNGKNYELDIINVGAAVCRKKFRVKLCFDDFYSY